MSDSGQTPTTPMPRPPGAATPRRPRPPRERGTDLEPERSPAQLKRRSFVWLGLASVGAALGACAVKFFFPRTIFEPPTTFSVGYPGDYGFGVDSKWQSTYRIWVCRDAEKLYVIYAVCTHLGCTPDWVSSANKFKCPCHGSGYDSAGVNFEGPAPRPMDRAEVTLAPDGQLVVNTLKLFQEKDWGNEDAFVKV
jgi:cytochrome b6-f complex iron-sulfur subunit